MSDIDMFSAKESLSILKNPFEADKLEKLSIYCFRNIFSQEWKYHGSVMFKNGLTEGEQKFEGKSLADLIQKIETFIASL